jgi:peptidoglycan/LPS O-acetylase OafA/YrhL
MNSWLNWGWIRNPGPVSYSLYLLHSPIIGASSRLLDRVLPRGLFFGLFELIVVIAACLIVSWFVFPVVERPGIALATGFP